MLDIWKIFSKISPKKRPEMHPRIKKGPKTPPAIGEVIPKKIIIIL